MKTGAGNTTHHAVSVLQWLVILVFMVVAAGALLTGQLTRPLLAYDELLYATNAMEMRNNGHYLVSYFDGAPDMWNTKPPLWVWAQALSMSLFGTGELGVRFPTLLVVLLTFAWLMRFACAELRRVDVGILAAAILLTSLGYFAWHVALTGDTDAAVALFATVASLSYYRYVSGNELRPRYLYHAVSALVLAVLTKGVFGLLYVPAWALYTLYCRRTREVLTSRALLVSAVGFVLVVGGFYAFREAVNPGYLRAVWENELGGRYSAVLENHSGSITFYARNIMYRDFTPWVYAIPMAVATAWFLDAGAWRRLGVFLIGSLLTFLAIISVARTKNDWYVAPFLPMASLLVALGFCQLYDAYVQPAGPTASRYRHGVAPQSTQRRRQLWSLHAADRG
jgi:4-amino-4-deoxy-L-arabinose transferase-like glycosyltransferase